MPNYEKIDSGLVKTCAYDKPVQPKSTSGDFLFGNMPKIIFKNKMGCDTMGSVCKIARGYSQREKNPDGGEEWFIHTKKKLDAAIKNKNKKKMRLHSGRLNSFIHGIKTYNKEQEALKKSGDLNARVYNLKWYSHSIHDELLKINANPIMKNNGISVELNNIIFCATMGAGAGCDGGKWEATYANDDPNCKKKKPKAAFGSTVKSKAKPLTKPSTATKETTKKYMCASRVSRVENKNKGPFPTEAVAKKECSKREIVVKVNAWAGGRKSRRRRRRRSRRKGRKSRKSRKRNKRKSRRKRKRRSRKRRR